MSDEQHQRLRAWLILHGSIVLFLGLAAGGPYDMALLHAWGAEAVRAWVLAHSAGVLCGAMALAVAGVMPELKVGRAIILPLVVLVSASVYAFTAGMWLAAILSARGIFRWQSTTDFVVNLFYMAGAWTGLAAAAVLIVGATITVRRSGR